MGGDTKIYFIAEELDVGWSKGQGRNHSRWREENTGSWDGKEPKLLKRGLNLVSLGQEEGAVIKGEVKAKSCKGI